METHQLVDWHTCTLRWNMAIFISPVTRQRLFDRSCRQLWQNFRSYGSHVTNITWFGKVLPSDSFWWQSFTFDDIWSCCQKWLQTCTATTYQARMLCRNNWMVINTFFRHYTSLQWIYWFQSIKINWICCTCIDKHILIEYHIHDQIVPYIECINETIEWEL